MARLRLLGRPPRLMRSYGLISTRTVWESPRRSIWWRKQPRGPRPAALMVQMQPS